jgi:hypothetical protein
MSVTRSNIELLNKYTDRIEALNKQLEQLSKGTKDYNRILQQKIKLEEKAAKASEQLGQNVGKLNASLPNNKKLIDESAKAQKRFSEATNVSSNSTKGFFGRLKTATGTLFRYSLAYKAINTATQLFNELIFESAKRAIRLEKALGDVAAIANLSADEISRLKDVVFDVAGSTSLTATEVVELQKQLAKLGTSVSDIENLTKSIALLSQALGEDAGGVAAALKKTLNQFQATTEEADKFANVLVGAVNETALSLNDLGTALQYVGPLAAQSGVSFEETASLLGILADNGFRASRAGTGLRNVLLEAAKSGKPFSEFLQELSERNLDVAEATEIFGKRGASAAIVLANNVDRLSELSDELLRSDRLLLANAKQMATTQGQLDLLASAYDKFSTKIGESITNSNFFIDALLILDKQSAGLAQTYKILANATEETTDKLNGIRNELQIVGNESSLAGNETVALGQAFGILRESGQFSALAIKDALFEMNHELDNGATMMEALEAAQKRGYAGAQRLASATIELYKILRAQAEQQDELIIAQEANNDSVKRYGTEYEALLQLTKEGIQVDKEKQLLQSQINADILSYSSELEQLTNKIKPLTKDEQERVRILEKRIALLSEQSTKIGELSVAEETLASQRKKADKADRKRIESELKDYIDRIKETEDVIKNLRVEVSEEAFPVQIDLLNGFFGEAEDIIEEAKKRFGANSDFVKQLIETLKKTADEIAVQLPKETQEIINLPSKMIGDITDGSGGAELKEIQKPAQYIAKTFYDKVKEAFEGLDWGAVIVDSVATATSAIEDFNDVALENTKSRAEQELDVVKSRYQIEESILKSQLDNQLITESQYRKKQTDLRKAQIAEENDIEKKIFLAEKKRDRQNASTDYLEAIASIIPTLITYDKTADPVSVLTKAAITGALATAAYGAELAAIGQRQFFPKKFAEGGVVNGPSHSQGGVPFSVQGQGGYEMEGGEYIINKRATAMHKDLLDRINASGMTRPQIGKYKFAQGGLVNSPVNESVDYLKAIAEATTSTAIGVSKPVRAYISDKDLRSNATERRIRDRNDRL